MNYKAGQVAVKGLPTAKITVSYKGVFTIKHNGNTYKGFVQSLPA